MMQCFDELILETIWKTLRTQAPIAHAEAPARARCFSQRGLPPLQTLSLELTRRYKSISGIVATEERGVGPNG